MSATVATLLGTNNNIPSGPLSAQGSDRPRDRQCAGYCVYVCTVPPTEALSLHSRMWMKSQEERPVLNTLLLHIRSYVEYSTPRVSPHSYSSALGNLTSQYYLKTIPISAAGNNLLQGLLQAQLNPGRLMHLVSYSTSIHACANTYHSMHVCLRIR